MSIKASFIVPHPPMIIPDIGRGEEIKIQKTIDAYDRVGKEISKIKPDTIIISTPHSIMYSDYIHISPGNGAKGSFGDFGYGNISCKAKYDEDLAKTISSEAAKEDIPAGFLGEQSKDLDHGVMVPLYFINKYYRDYSIVRISISGLSYLDHYRFGKAIQKAVDESRKNVVFLGSGDLSHVLKEDGPYGYREEGPKFDKEVTQAMASGDFMKFLRFDENFCETAAECGLRSFIIMAGALDGKKLDSNLLSYEGPFGVGYALATFYPIGKDSKRHFDEIYIKEEMKKIESLKNKEDEHVRLARQTVESYVMEGRSIDIPHDLSPELLENQAGVFVTLNLDGSLRGCIGTISPTKDNIAEEIIHNAINAAFEDPRFSPVRKEELSRLVYSVDVLGESEAIKSMDELDTKEYGVIVSKGGRRGLLLPNIDGADSVEEQVSIALEKAGINPNEDYQMERFKVVRHS